ncbi:MAG: MarR family transcriptional regulator [Rhizobium sp.]|nr:MarR family transcriptional regulator [Rhizobium sp.]
MINKPLSTLETHLGYWLRMVSNAVSHSFGRKVEAEGVTVAEWVLLRMLYDVDRSAPSLLADHMGMTRGAISKLAERLLEKGLIERAPSAEDKRAHTLALTSGGRGLVPRLAALADANDLAFFGGLTAGERQQLEHLLRKIASERSLIDMPVD